MMKVTRMAPYLLTASALAFGLALSGPALAQSKTGQATVVLKHISAHLQNGSADTSAADLIYCAKKLNDPTSRYYDMKVVTNYSVAGLTQSAQSTFRSPNSTQPLELSAQLHPLGLAGEYAFMGFSTDLPQDYIMFSMTSAFTDPQSTFLVRNQGMAFNCVISSAAQVPADVAAKLSATAR